MTVEPPRLEITRRVMGVEAEKQLDLVERLSVHLRRSSSSEYVAS